MNRRILLLGGKDRLVPAVKRAQAMGLFVVLADGNPNAPGLMAADVGVHCDISNEHEVLALAQRAEIGAVLSLSEYGVRSAAYTASALGLSGISVEAAHRATDKCSMRAAWQHADLPQPDFRAASTLEDGIHALLDLGVPIVCKPCWSSASRGVTRVYEQPSFSAAYLTAARHDRQARVIIERCIAGQELSCEAFVNDGQLTLLAMADKEVESSGPTCLTWSLTYPSCLWDSLEGRVVQLLQRAAEAIGLTQGCCHAELLFCDNELYLLEMGARGGGGHIYTTIVQHVSGVDYVGASIAAACGVSTAFVPSRRHAACYRFIAGPCGTLQQIDGVNQALALSFVSEIGFCVSPGARLQKPQNGAERHGWILALASRRDEVINAAEEAARNVRFVVE